jgi:hypothetical protein
MMRTLTSNTNTKRQQQYASEPVIVLKIEWSSGAVWYGDKTFTLAPESIVGGLLEFSPIQATGKQDSVGEVASAGVTLDDTTGDLKILINTIIIEGTLVTAYHHYEGNAFSDLTLVFKGKIGGTITWDEGERKLNFDIESFIDDAEVGYAPEEGEIPNMAKEAVGVMWPIVFGGVLRIKATTLRKCITSALTGGCYGGWPYYDAMSFQVENGELFPQNVNMDLVVATTRFYGYFDGNIFHRSESNMLWYTNVAITDRVIDDPDVGSKVVVWLANNENLMQKHAWLGTNKQFNYCIRQEGNKCWFTDEWNLPLTSLDSFAEIRGCPHNTWYHGNSFLNYWYLKPASLVYEYNNPSDLFVVNEYPSTEIVEVMAKRTYEGSELFVQVPSSYYTIRLSDSIAGKNPTTIEFPQPLSTRTGEGWKDDVYVSVRSTLPNNTADIIKWLVETYTNYDVNVDSFNQARSDVAPYPSNFALFSQRNVISLIEDIAWQARCVVFIHNGEVSLKYISKDMPSDYTATREDLLFKTLKLGFIPTEEIYTKLVTTWKTEYSGEDLTEKTITYKNNIAQFGLRELERELFIYNIEELSKMSAYFWGYRYSNSWRTMNYVTLLRTLALELFDCVSHDINTLSSFTIRGLLEDVSHDSVSNEIAMQTLLCSRAGQHTGGQPIEDPNFWTGDPAYPVMPRPIKDPLSGRTIVNYVVPVEGGENKNTTGTPPVSGNYKFVFYQPTQDEIQRGTQFPITIKLEDAHGFPRYETLDIKLSLHSEDTGDVFAGSGFTEEQISMTNGEYTVTNKQITGGTTQQEYVTLSCVDKLGRAEYTSGISEPFKLVAPKTGVLTWAAGPTGSIARGTAITISITGGVAGEVIDVERWELDAQDDIHDTNGLDVTSITLGGGGTYSGTWRVVGGSGTQTGAYFRLVDSRYSKYANADSSTFNIPGNIFVRQLTQSLVVQQQVIPNSNKLVLTRVSGVIDGIIRLNASYRDADDNIITSYNGAVEFYALDANDNEVQWSAPASCTSFIPAMVAGVYENDFELVLTSLNASPISIFSTITIGEGVYYDSKDFPYIGAELLEQTFSVDQLVEHSNVNFEVLIPTQITRGVAFDLYVQARDEDEAVYDYVPTGDLTITLVGGNGEIITPNIIDNTGWFNGNKTVSVTVSGGTGNKALTIEVED